MQINREELAWAAGFFDGEGHTSHTSRRYRKDGDSRYLYHYIQAVVSQSGQTLPETLTRFHNAVSGIGVINGPYMTTRQRLPAWRWCAGGFKKTQAVIAMLWAFLSTS